MSSDDGVNKGRSTRMWHFLEGVLNKQSCVVPLTDVGKGRNCKIECAVVVFDMLFL